MTFDLKEKYKSEIREQLFSIFSYRNIHEIPKVQKISISCGLGLNGQNKGFLQKAINEIKIITGQQPLVTKSKKSIAGFKIREGMDLGLKVTLRKERMYSFLARLIHLVLPRVRDFQGLSSKGFDSYGNYSLGLSEQLVFPEIKYEEVDQKRGFNITIVTTATTKQEALVLLQKLGLPIEN